MVTLSKTVDGFLKKWAAERAALRVEGVRAVVNHIGAILRGVGVRTDTDIARAVAMALEENPSASADRTKVRVEEGRVTLENEADWHYQHRKAKESARRVTGVKSVINLTTVKQPSVSANSIKEPIEQALVQHAELDAENIQVRVEYGARGPDRHRRLLGRAQGSRGGGLLISGRHQGDQPDPGRGPVGRARDRMEPGSRNCPTAWRSCSALGENFFLSPRAVSRLPVADARLKVRLEARTPVCPAYMRYSCDTHSGGSSAGRDRSTMGTHF